MIPLIPIGMIGHDLHLALKEVARSINKDTYPSYCRFSTTLSLHCIKTYVHLQVAMPLESAKRIARLLLIHALNV